MKKQLLPVILCILPFSFAFYLYPNLPEIIPTHFDINGKANDWNSKNFIFIGAALPLFIWVLFLFIRKFDPKDRINEMGSKFDNFLLINILLMSILGCFMIYTMAHAEFKFDTRFMLFIAGAIFILIGNYMPSFKPNYFMGVRTPWTLESEEVWRKTHKLGGLLHILGGLCIMCIGLFADGEMMFKLMLAIIFTISLIPMGYSYWYFQKLKKEGKLN
jgi:uncharacterized membrane protein